MTLRVASLALTSFVRTSYDAVFTMTQKVRRTDDAESERRTRCSRFHLKIVSGIDIDRSDHFPISISIGESQTMVCRFTDEQFFAIVVRQFSTVNKSLK